LRGGGRVIDFENSGYGYIKKKWDLIITYKLLGTVNIDLAI
jgi:hypothetical protein